MTENDVSKSIATLSSQCVIQKPNEIVNNVCEPSNREDFSIGVASFGNAFPNESTFLFCFCWNSIKALVGQQDWIVWKFSVLAIYKKQSKGSSHLCGEQ